MQTSVTISIPVTARFDGCWCSTKCNQIRLVNNTHYCTFYDEYLKGEASRCERCCETFGMGEQVKEPLLAQIQEPRRYDE